MSDFRSPWEELAPYLARAGETIANAVLQNNNMFLQEKDDAVNQISIALQDPMLSQEDRDFLANKLRGIEGANNMQDLRSWTQTTKPVTRVIEGPGMAPMEGGGVSLGAPTIQLDVGAQPGVTEATADAIATAEQNRQAATLGLQLATPVLENVYSLQSSGFFNQLTPEQQKRVQEIQQNVSTLLSNPSGANAGQLVGFMSELAGIQASVGDIENAQNIAIGAAESLMQSWRERNMQADDALVALGAFKTTPMWEDLPEEIRDLLEAEATNAFGFDPDAYRQEWFGLAVDALRVNSPMALDGAPDEAWKTAASALGIQGWTTLEGEELYDAVREEMLRRSVNDRNVMDWGTSSARIDHLSKFNSDEIYSVLDSDPALKEATTDEELARALRIAQNRERKEAMDSPEVQTAYDVLEAAGNGTTRIDAPGSILSWDDINNALDTLQDTIGLTDQQRAIIEGTLEAQQAGLDAAVAQARRDEVFRAAGIIPEWNINDYRTQILNLESSADAQLLRLRNNVNDEGNPCVFDTVNGGLSFNSGGVCDVLREEFDLTQSEIVRANNIAAKQSTYNIIPGDVNLSGFEYFDTVGTADGPSFLEAVDEIAAMARAGASVEDMNARADELREEAMRGRQRVVPVPTPSATVIDQQAIARLAEINSAMNAGLSSTALIEEYNQLFDEIQRATGLSTQEIERSIISVQETEPRVLFPSETDSVMGQAPDAPAGETPFTGNFSNSVTANMAMGSGFAESRGSENPYAAINDGEADVTGGWSYGKYQLASNVGSVDEFMTFLKLDYPSLYDSLNAAGGADAAQNGTEAFRAAWTRLSELPEFQRAQDKFIEEMYFAPAYSELVAMNYEPTDFHPVVLQALGETKVNVGGNFLSLINALPDTLSSMPPEEAINAIYDYRLRENSDGNLIEYLSSTPEMQDNIRRNLNNVRNNFLRMLRREQ